MSRDFPQYYDPSNSNIPVTPSSNVYSGHYVDQAGIYWQTNEIISKNLAKPPDLYQNYVQPQDTYTNYNYLTNSMGYQCCNWSSLVQYSNPIDPVSLTDTIASEPPINHPYNSANQPCCNVPGCGYPTKPYIDYTMANYNANIHNKMNTKHAKEGSGDSNSNTDFKTKKVTGKEHKLQILCPSRSILDKLINEKQKNKQELEENMRRYFSDLWECNSEKINNADAMSKASKPSSDKILNRYRDYERFIRNSTKKTDTTHNTVIKNHLSYKKAHRAEVASPNNQSLNNKEEKGFENKNTHRGNKFQEIKENQKRIKNNDDERKCKDFKQESESKDTTEKTELKNTINEKENLVTDVEYKWKNKKNRNVLNSIKRKSNINRDTDFNYYCSDYDNEPEKKRRKADIDRDKIKTALAKIAAKTKEKKRRLEAESELQTRSHKPENILISKKNTKPNVLETNQTRKLHKEKKPLPKKYSEMIKKSKSVRNKADTNSSKIHKNKYLSYNQTEVKDEDQYCNVLKKLEKCCGKIQLNKQKHKLIESKLSKINKTRLMNKMKLKNQNHTQSSAKKDVILLDRNENNNIPLKTTVESNESTNSFIDDTEKISSDSFGDISPIIETVDSSTPDQNINSPSFDKKKCEDTNNDLIKHNTENELNKHKRLMSPICKPKTKKRKTIKLVINIECHSSESSDVDEYNNIEHRTSTPTYDDTTFLDDFNVDEIVNSLDGQVKDIDNKKASIDVSPDMNKSCETKQESIESNSMLPDYKNEAKNELSVESCAAIYKYLLDSYNNRPHQNNNQMNITDSIKDDMAKQVVTGVATENCLPNVVSKTDSNVIEISDDDDECTVYENTNPMFNGSLTSAEGDKNKLAPKIRELSSGSKKETESESKEETCAEIFKFIVESYDDNFKKQNEVCQNDNNFNSSSAEVVPIKTQEKETLIEDYPNPSSVPKDTEPKHIGISNVELDTYSENSDRASNMVLLNVNHSCKITVNSTGITSNAETSKDELLGAHSAHTKVERGVRRKTAPPVITSMKEIKSPCQTQTDSNRTVKKTTLDKKMQPTKALNTRIEKHIETHTHHTKNIQVKNLHTNKNNNSSSKITKLIKYQPKLEDGVNKLNKNGQHRIKQKTFEIVNMPTNKHKFEKISGRSNLLKLVGNKDSNTKSIDNTKEQKTRPEKFEKLKPNPKNCYETRTSCNKNNLSELKEIKEKEHSSFALSTGFDPKLLMSKEKKNENFMNNRNIPKISSKNTTNGSFVFDIADSEKDKNEITLKAETDKPKDKKKANIKILDDLQSTRNKISQKVTSKIDKTVEKETLLSAKTSTKLHNILLKGTASKTNDKDKIKAILDIHKKIEEPLASSSVVNKKIIDDTNADQDMSIASKDKTRQTESEKISKVIKESNRGKRLSTDFKITHDLSAPKEKTLEIIKSNNHKRQTENQPKQISTNIDHNKSTNKKTLSGKNINMPTSSMPQKLCQGQEIKKSDITKSFKIKNKTNLNDTIIVNKETNSEELVSRASKIENLNKNENTNHSKTLTVENYTFKTTEVEGFSEKFNKATSNITESIGNKASKNEISEAEVNDNNSLITNKQELQRIEDKPASERCNNTTPNITPNTENNLKIKTENYVNSPIIIDKHEQTVIEQELPNCDSITDLKVLAGIIIENNINDLNQNIKTENVKETIIKPISDTQDYKSNITAANTDSNCANTTLPTQLNIENPNSPVNNKNAGKAVAAKDFQTIADNTCTNNNKIIAQPEIEKSNKSTDDDKTTETLKSKNLINKSNNFNQSTTTKDGNEAKINEDSDIEISKVNVSSNAGQNNNNISITTNNGNKNKKTTTTQELKTTEKPENNKSTVTNKSTSKEEITVNKNINQTNIKPTVDVTAQETDKTKVLHKNKQTIRSEVKFGTGKNISDNHDHDRGENREHDIKEKLFLCDLKMKMVRMDQKFSITSLLHTGYSSTIYKCNDKHNQNYVVKICPYSLQHPNKMKLLLRLQKTIIDNDICIRSIIKSFHFQGRWCVLMDYYPSTLRQVLDERRCGFHIDTVQILSRQLVTAVAELTNHGIIHSDINPRHILLNSNHTRLKLCGFDRSNYANSLKILPCTSATSYRAPEAILGFNADYRIDVWATALVMYEMVTAKTLFVAHNNNQLLLKQISTVGCVSSEFVRMSQFGHMYFSGTSYIMKFPYKPFVKLIHTITMNSILRTSVFSSYERDWEYRRNRWQVTQDLDKLEIFYDLLEKMLVPDPRYRLPITFVVANEFIHDMFT